MSTALPVASFVTEFWNDQLVDHDRQGVFLVLVGFIGSFAFIRMSTRMIRAEVSWWPGNIESESGLHVHHLVFGIITMMVAGTLGFAAAGHSPWTEITAFFFGASTGATASALPFERAGDETAFFAGFLVLGAAMVIISVWESSHCYSCHGRLAVIEGVPDLFADEGHNGREQPQRGLEDAHKCGEGRFGLVFICGFREVEAELDDL